MQGTIVGEKPLTFQELLFTLQRFWAEHAQKRFRRHGAGADFDVIRLLQHTSALSPEALKAKEQFLKGKRGGR